MQYLCGYFINIVYKQIILKLLYTEENTFPPNLFLLLLTGAEKSHKPWGRPGHQGIIQVWGIMTLLSLSGSLPKLLLGPVSSRPSRSDGSINGDPSLTIIRASSSHFTRLMPFSKLIIPHCGNHKKGKLSHFHLRSFFEGELSFLFFFFLFLLIALNFASHHLWSCPCSLLLPSPHVSLSFPLSLVCQDNKCVIIIDFSGGLIFIPFILAIRAAVPL